MNRHAVRFTEEAGADLLRQYAYLVERDPGGAGEVAERALDCIARGIEMLELSPYTY